ncbi:MAG: acetyl-CoA carboxylase biotin carboxyl carrier protein [Bacteriovoracaceae bacterium]|nr:acetyl-CoA carboxylase biotin carboxyl carrier protein [Bacteriovoracaceae bacterium]
MDLKILKEFIQLAKDEGVSELKYETKEQKLSVAFGGQTSVMTHVPAAMPAKVESAASASASTGEKFHEIKSPFVGTFYASPSPDKAAYVKVGDKVSNGQTLCILEAMKIMNEIESDISGEIVEICVENESLVEYGQTLFKIRS